MDTGQEEIVRHVIEQNTPEWLQLRVGRFTASSIKDLFMAKTTAGYQKAIYGLAFERLTGESPESYSNDAMERGHQMEPLARQAYELETFNTVEDGGFFTMGEWLGCSPDGLVGDDGLLEIKSPAYNTMIGYLLDPKLPSIYKWQVHSQMWITGRQWCSFMCYHPKLKSIIIRIDRDEKLIKELSDKVEESIEEVKRIIEKIR